MPICKVALAVWTRRHLLDLTLDRRTRTP
jgi:hypothetical protein